MANHANIRVPVAAVSASLLVALGVVSVVGVAADSDTADHTHHQHMHTPDMHTPASADAASADAGGASDALAAQPDHAMHAGGDTMHAAEQVDHTMHAGDHAGHTMHAGDHADHAMHAGGDEHAHHKAMMAQKGYERSEEDYALIDVPLVDKDGDKTTLLTELNGDKPVIVTFVFTTCTTICPVLSGTFSQLQAELGSDIDNVQMVSVSIDPEYDTPERLRAYAELFKAGPQWHFLTGKLDDIVAIQKTFDVYRGNKMNHEPTILLRKSQESPWIRMDGLASAAEVAEEYRRMMAASQG